MVAKMVANRSFHNAAVYSRSKRRVEPRCGIGLHRIGDVRIQVHSSSDGGMPQTFLSDFRMNSIGQELGCVTVSEVMETHPWKFFNTRYQSDELASEAARLLGLPVFSAAHKDFARLSNSESQ